MKTLLILTGPQGSGNHLWSKIFALHPYVKGWSALLDEYWIGHDQEPWADCWLDPSRMKYKDTSQHNYFVTSVSVPYMNNGEAVVPKFKEFVKAAQTAGFIVKIAVLGRDKNIISYQEQRVRGAETYNQALAAFQEFSLPTFLSYELLQLYGKRYLESISAQLQFPIALNDPRLDKILEEDTNKKYLKQSRPHKTDDLAKHASRKHT